MNPRYKNKFLISNAAYVLDEAASYVTDEKILPCEEGNRLAEDFAEIAMHLREFDKKQQKLLEVCSGICDTVGVDELAKFWPELSQQIVELAKVLDVMEDKTPAN